MTLRITLQHRFPALSLDVAFEAEGGVTALFGPSGAGKTTIANAVAGLMRPDAGQIVLNGRTLFAAGVWVPPHRRRIGYVFQDANLFPHMSVRANLLYGASGGTQLRRIVDLLGIGALLDRRPARLSGGERQRVAIGRALLSEPELLIMDEPLSALDLRRKADILPFLERLSVETTLPILYVSHSLAEIVRLADRIALIEDGKLAGFGTPAELLADPALATVLGPRQSGAMLDGRLEEIEPDGLARITTAAGPLLLPIETTRGPVRIRIMAEDVMLSRTAPEGLSALNVLPARVDSLRPEGPTALVRLRLDGGTHLLARVTVRYVNALALHPGAPVHAIVKTAALIGQS